MENTERPLFYSARLKIERANHHIKELIRVCNTFPQANLHAIGSEDNAETARAALKIQVNDEIFDEIALIIGDAVHTLRTALDHVAYELVTLSGGTPTTSTRFPFWKTRQEAIAGIEGVIQGVGLNIITHIIECVQPYKGGKGDALYALHALDITDKHRLIVPIFTTGGVKFRVENDGGSGVLAFTLKRGEKTRMVYPRSGAKIEGHPNLTLYVCFDDVDGFDRQPVIKTLRKLRQIVRAVVEEIEWAYRDSRKPHPL